MTGAHTPSTENVLDDIKIEYHPSSYRHPVISHFEDFTRARAASENVPEENRIDHFVRVSTLSLLKSQWLQL